MYECTSNHFIRRGQVGEGGGADGAGASAPHGRAEHCLVTWGTRWRCRARSRRGWPWHYGPPSSCPKGRPYAHATASVTVTTLRARASAAPPHPLSFPAPRAGRGATSRDFPSPFSVPPVAGPHAPANPPHHVRQASLWRHRLVCALLLYGRRVCRQGRQHSRPRPQQRFGG